MAGRRFALRRRGRGEAPWTWEPLLEPGCWARQRPATEEREQGGGREGREGWDGRASGRGGTGGRAGGRAARGPGGGRDFGRGGGGGEGAGQSAHPRGPRPPLPYGWTGCNSMSAGLWRADELWAAGGIGDGGGAVRVGGGGGPIRPPFRYVDVPEPYGWTVAQGRVWWGWGLGEGPRGPCRAGGGGGMFRPLGRQRV